MKDLIWHGAEQFTAQKDRQIDLWRYYIESEALESTDLQSMLSTDEQEKCARFHFPEHRMRYAIAHRILRQLLANYIGGSPREIIIDVSEHGKPYLPQHASLQFNLSHSGDYIYYAFAHNTELGVDVEQHRKNTDYQAIASRFFDDSEYQALLALPASAQHIAFFNLWVLKESFLKAIGKGLTYPLKNVIIDFCEESAKIGKILDMPENAQPWSSTLLPCATGYSAAVVYKGNDLDLRLWDLNQSVGF